MVRDCSGRGCDGVLGQPIVTKRCAASRACAVLFSLVRRFRRWHRVTSAPETRAVNVWWHGDRPKLVAIPEPIVRLLLRCFKALVSARVHFPFFFTPPPPSVGGIGSSSFFLVHSFVAFHCFLGLHSFYPRGAFRACVVALAGPLRAAHARAPRDHPPDARPS